MDSRIVIPEVNSEKYWDQRFQHDWDMKNGDQQSIFFMELALDMLPGWLVEDLKAGDRNICDWGCAEGEGTNLMASRFRNCSFEGIDFAETAIKVANKRYPGPNLTFTAKDLLTTSHNTKYDVVFSSNVFEHFTNTWEVFDKISNFAKDLIIMLVPFNEDEANRTPEHFHTFRSDQFKLQGSRWDVVHFEVRNTTGPWNGQQALVIFAAKKYAEKKGLNFATLNLAGDRGAKLESNLKTLEQQNEVLSDKIANQDRLITEQEHKLAHLGDLVNSRRFRLSVKLADYANKAVPPKSMRRNLVTSPIKLAKYVSADQKELRAKRRAAQKERSAFRRRLIQLAEGHSSVVVYPSMPWDHVLHQRPHHLAEQLAAIGQLVVYVDRTTKEQKVINNNLIIVDGDWCTDVLASSRVRNKYLLLHSTHGQPFDELTAIVNKGFKLIYEYIDEIDEAINGDTTNQTELFERLEELNPVLLLASAKKLYTQLNKRFPESMLLLSANAVDTTHFSLVSSEGGVNVPSDIKEIIDQNKPIVGYYGAIAPWLDYELINDLATKRQDLSFVFIGDDYQESLGFLNMGNNVHYLGAKPYASLPQYSRWFDCATIPFKKGEIAKSTSPLKLFEYMAMGIPTVCTRDLRECMGYDYVYVAKTDVQFNEFIDKAIAAKRSGECLETLLGQAAKNTWQARAVEIYNRIADL